MMRTLHHSSIELNPGKGRAGPKSILTQGSKEEIIRERIYMDVKSIPKDWIATAGHNVFTSACSCNNYFQSPLPHGREVKRD